MNFQASLRPSEQSMLKVLIPFLVLFSHLLSAAELAVNVDLLTQVALTPVEQEMYDDAVVRTPARKPRTWPVVQFDTAYGVNVPRFKLDPEYASHKTYVYSNFQTVNNYEDPEWNIALSMPDPLLDAKYNTYEVLVVVNISDVKIGEQTMKVGQTMRVYKRGEGLKYFWKVSTAKQGSSTPTGFFTVEGFSSKHASSLYNNAPMSYAIFFNGNIASHSTIKQNYMWLGTRQSHGCARLEEQRARDLFHTVGGSGFGLVDALNKKTGEVSFDASGDVKQTYAFKTLFIIEK